MEGGYNPAVGEGVWLRIKRYSWGHTATCSGPVSCKHGRLPRVGGSDPTFQVRPDVSVWQYCFGTQ